MKGWDGLDGWLIADGLHHGVIINNNSMVYIHSGHPSAAGQTQDRESSPVEDQRSTTVTRNATNLRLWDIDRCFNFSILPI